MKRFVSYYRVSTDRQGKTRLGLDAQREAINRHLSPGDVLIAQFTEVESGKSHKNRPQLAKALEECRRQRATLLIAKLDRLGRNVAFISALMESGVDFVCCDNPHATRLVLHIMAAFAEHERLIISERTRESLARVKAELKEKGFRRSLAGNVYSRLGPPDPLAALAKANAAKQIRPPAEHVLDLIDELRDQGSSYRAIVAELERRDIRTPSGCRWYPSTVRTAHEITKERNRGNTMGRNEESVNSTSRLPQPLIAATPAFVTSNAGQEATQAGGNMGAIDEAQRMLYIFTSVGAQNFMVTKLNLLQEKIWAKLYSPAELEDKVPFIMRTADVHKPIQVSAGNTIYSGENVVIRPSSPTVTFVQLDDFKADQLNRLKPAAFVVIETSPANYQAWIAVSGKPADKEQEKEIIRRVRKAVGQSDKAASGATRLAGTSNFKTKYAPEFPTVTMTHTAAGRVLTLTELAAIGLVAVAEPIRPPIIVERSHTERRWPSYDICLMRAPKKPDGSPDRSKADFSFALTSLTGGRGTEETIERLKQVSERVRERERSDPGYARVTVENAAKMVARNYGKSRSRA